MKYIKIAPFLIPFINLISIILKFDIRLDVIIESFILLITTIVIIKKKIRLRDNVNLVFFICFIVLHTMCSFSFFSHIADTILTVNFQLILVLNLLIFYSAYPLTDKEIYLSFRLLNYFGIINVIFVLFNFIGLPLIITHDTNLAIGSRYFGVIGDQEAWLFSIFAFLNFQRKNIVLFILFSFVLLLTGSIGAALILVASIAVKYIFEFSGKKRLVFLIASLIFVPLIFELAITLNVSFVKRLQSDALTEEGAWGHRLAAFKNASEEMTSNIFWGFGNFAAEMVYKYDYLLSEYDKGKLTYLASANNQFLAVILDYGILGFILFLLVICSLTKNIRKKNLENYPSTSYSTMLLFKIWLVVFLIFNQSYVWFVPGSFMYLVLILYFSIFISINKNSLISKKILING